MNIKLLADSCLTQTELASLFGVSRVTVNHWYTGRHSPHQLHRVKIADTAKKLADAIESGKLPLPPGIRRPPRLPAAREILGLTP